MSDVADRLRALADAATPGPWRFHDSSDPRGRKGEFRAPSPHNGLMLVGPWTNSYDAPLMALAPELARGYADALDALARYYDYAPHLSYCQIGDGPCDCGRDELDALHDAAFAAAARLFPEDEA